MTLKKCLEISLLFIFGCTSDDKIDYNNIRAKHTDVSFENSKPPSKKETKKENEDEKKKEKIRKKLEDTEKDLEKIQKELEKIEK